jgi:hypothetical protein
LCINYLFFKTKYEMWSIIRFKKAEKNDQFTNVTTAKMYRNLSKTNNYMFVHLQALKGTSSSNTNALHTHSKPSQTNNCVQPSSKKNQFIWLKCNQTSNNVQQAWKEIRFFNTDIFYVHKKSSWTNNYSKRQFLVLKSKLTNYEGSKLQNLKVNAYVVPFKNPSYLLSPHSHENNFVLPFFSRKKS